MQKQKALAFKWDRYSHLTLCLQLILFHWVSFSLAHKYETWLKESSNDKHFSNRTACIRHQCRKTTVLSCRRCLISIGDTQHNDIHLTTFSIKLLFPTFSIMTFTIPPFAIMLDIIVLSAAFYLLLC